MKDVPGSLAYSAVFAAAGELGYSELQAMAYATDPDLFVAENPDWDFGITSENSSENVARFGDAFPQAGERER